MTRQILSLILLIGLSLLLLVLYDLVPTPNSVEQQVTITQLPHKWVGNILAFPEEELSGITYHPKRKTLFTINDEGGLSEYLTDGRVVRQAMINSDDLEGLTVDPISGLLYAVVEGRDAILEISPQDFKIQYEFRIDRDFEGRELLKKGGMGLEAITFVADKSHAEGGTFWVGNQSFSLKPNKEPSIVCQIEVPIKTRQKQQKRGIIKKMKGKIVKFFPLDIIDVSGLMFDQNRKRLLVLSDTTNLLLEMSLGGEIWRRYLLTGEDQEGITLDHMGFLYFAQENGQIIKLEDRRE
ncbi:hypothetical protein CMK20_16060 [Candidatus Poribacteria bacterium]|nr:hypothetical protein [Candidatus Poribacteria bacterium]